MTPPVHATTAPGPYDFLPAVGTFTLTSDDLTDGSALPLRHAAAAAGGQNLSPHLAWHGQPDHTQGFAVSCYDPDAPTGSGFWHWLMTDIPADTHELPRDAGSTTGLHRPSAATALPNDLGSRGYDGAAPPPGAAHRYLFTLHALDVPRLDLPPEATNALARFHLTLHTVGRAVLLTTFPAPHGPAAPPA